MEIVNLVSDEEGDDDDDDAECNQHDEITAQPPPILRRTTRQRLRVNGSSTGLTTDSEETSTIPSPHLQVTPSARIRTPMLSKKLDDNSLCYKRKPESYAKLVDQKKAKECALPPLNGTHKKVVVAATIRKGAPASSPLTVRNQASSPIMTTGRIAGKYEIMLSLILINLINCSLVYYFFLVYFKVDCTRLRIAMVVLVLEMVWWLLSPSLKI